MPTKHRRIAVTADEELEQALERTRAAAPDAPAADAALVKRLALRGAEVIERENGERDEFTEWLIAQGGTPAKRPLGEILDEIEPMPMDPDDPYRAQRILEELREERLS